MDSKVVEIGQTKKGSSRKTIEVETKLKSGKYPMIAIPRKILEELTKETGTNLFKLHIENDVNIEYYWEYNPNKKPYLVFKELKAGRYKITITPYTLKDFIKEFNSKSVHQGIKIQISNQKLILKVKDQKELSTDKWRFEKEHGGSVHIIAEYPSPTRSEGKAILKYQIKRGEANIYILEKQGERKRLSPHRIVDIKIREELAEVIYKHGNKIKISIILMRQPKSPENQNERENIEIITSKTLMISGYMVKKLTYIVKGEDLFNKLSKYMMTSYQYLRRGKYQEFNDIRERIGMKLALEYMKRLGFTIFVVHPNKSHLSSHAKKYFGKLEPDILAFKEDGMCIVEVKFRYNEKSGRYAFISAVNQVKKYLDEFIKQQGSDPPYNVFDYLVENISLAALIIGFDSKKRGGYIYFWEGKR